MLFYNFLAHVGKCEVNEFLYISDRLPFGDIVEFLIVGIILVGRRQAVNVSTF